MKKSWIIIKNFLFSNEKEYTFFKKILPLTILILVLSDIFGLIYYKVLYFHFYKIIILELLFIFVLLNPKNGIYLVLAAWPLEFTETWFAYYQIKLYRIIIIYIFLGWGMRKIIYKDFNFLIYFKNKINILLFLFIIWNAVTLFYSVLWKDGLGEVVRMSFYFIFLIILLDSFQNYNKIKDFIYYILGISIIIAFIGIYEKFSGKSVYYPIGYYRIASTFFDPNIFGRYLIINSLIALSLILYKKNNLLINVLLFISIGLFLMDILFTRSRSSIVALLIGFMILILVHKKRLQLLFFFIVILTIIFFILPGEYKERVTSIIKLNLDQPQFNSVKARIALEIAGIKIIKDYFLFGIGVGSFPHYFCKYNKLPFDASESHDFLTTTFAELGIIGLILSLVIIYMILKELYLLYNISKNRWIFISLYTIIIGIFIHSIFYANFFYYFYLWFFIFIVLKSKEQLSIK